MISQPRRRVTATAHRFARALGVDVVRYPGPASWLGNRAARLREHGIDLVIDVGANTGQCGVELRSLGYRGRIVSFEPLPAAFAGLEAVARADGDWTCHRVALGDRAGSATLVVAGNSVSSSLLPMTELHRAAAPASEPVGEARVETVRLDAIFDSIVGEARRPFLKIDTQGYELHVLEGTIGVLDRVRGLQLELSLVSLYEGAPLMADVVAWVERHRFVLTDIEPEFRDLRTDRLLQVNGLFFRPRSAVGDDS